MHGKMTDTFAVVLYTISETLPFLCPTQAQGYGKCIIPHAVIFKADRQYVSVIRLLDSLLALARSSSELSNTGGIT